MESFTVPTSETEWPDDKYFVDSSEIEDVDGVLEVVASRIEKRPENLYERRNFGVLLSLVKKGTKLRADNRTRILSALRVAIGSFSAGFAKNHQHWITLPECKDLERQFVQTLKAYAFLLSRIVLVEDGVLKGQKEKTSEAPMMAPTKRRGKKQQNEDAAILAQQGKVSIWHLEREREEILSAVVALIELPLSQVWMPDISLLNLFAHLAFNLVENPLNAKSASIRSSCMAILRPLIITYNYQSEIILRFVHNLRTSEFIVAATLDLIDSMKHDQAVLPFLSELFREVAKIVPRDVSSNALLAKNLASTICDICTTFPKLVLPSVSLVIELLEHEAYTVRSGVIQGIGVLIIEGFKDARPENEASKEAEQAKTGESADEEATGAGKTKKSGSKSKKSKPRRAKKPKRASGATDDNEEYGEEDEDDESDEDEASREADEEFEKSVAPPIHATLEALLDILGERLMDVSSYTRSKVLTTWALLAQARAIPLNRYILATEGAFKRLTDKAANVRKTAIELLHDLIEHNPYGPNLSLPIWEERLREVRETLSEKGVPSSQVHTPMKVVAKKSSAKRGAKAKKSAAKKSSKAETADSGVELDSGAEMEVDEDAKVDEAVEAVEEAAEGADDVAEEAMEVDLEEKSVLDAEGGGVEVTTAVDGVKDVGESLDDEQVAVAKRAKEHCVQTLKFIRIVHQALPIVTTLLGSKNIGDVTEAIKLLAKAHTFKTEQAIDGIRTVLMLVCSKEAGIKEAATQAYIDLYLTPAVHVSAKDMPVFIARNLISLTQKATLGQVTSLEELLKELATAGRISAQILPVLWSYFEFKADHRCGALMILTMLQESFPNALSKLVPHLFKFGLGPVIADHPELAKWTFLALQKIAKPSEAEKTAKNKKTTSADDEDAYDHHSDNSDDEEMSGVKKKKGRGSAKRSAPKKAETTQKSKNEASLDESNLSAPFDAASIVAVCNFLTLTGNASPKNSKKSTPNIESSAWYPAAEQAINAIYYLSDAPGVVLTEVLKKMAVQLQRVQGLPSASSNESQVSGASAAMVLGRIIFVLGHIAIKQLVFIEEVTRDQQLMKSQQKQNATSGAVTKKKRSAKPKRKSKKKDSDDEEDYEEGGTDEEGSEPEAIELELGAVGAEAAGETHDEERARMRAQHAMVTRNAIGQFLPLVVAICQNSTIRVADPVLFGVAVHTMSKCMLVSQEACSTHLEIMKRIASDTTETTAAIRSNLVILMGDLAMRFPNLFESHSYALYERLSDMEPSVRKTALVVVSHLVLTNMVKPRGHMSDIAVCLEDKETNIVDAARLFFKELASKDNALMLLLPDTISSLYRKNLDFDTAKSILQFLLSFVDLQRDLTSLVDKLCQQFPNSPEKRSWRYLAYCMSMLNHNDASIERLASHFKLYKDALHDETTNGFFLQAVRGRRSKGGFAASSTSGAGGAGGAGTGGATDDANAAGGAQQTGGADTLEEKIIAIAEGTFVDGLEPEESTGKKRGKGKRGGAKATSKKRGRAALDDEEEDDDTAMDDDDEPAPSRAKPKRGAAKKAAAQASSRPQRATKKRFVPEDDSDDEVDFLDED